MKRALNTIIILLSAYTLFGQNSEVLIDKRDGQSYRVVKIENNFWMAENLNYYTRHSYFYMLDSINNSTYGRLYKYYEANRVCPVGWHLPNQYVYADMVEYFGGEKEAFDKLCETGTTHWTVRKKSTASNYSGFTALPGGSYSYHGKEIITHISKTGSYKDTTYFDNHPDLKGLSGIWWTCDSLDNKSKAKAFLVNGWIRKCLIIDRNQDLGLSIRCIKD